MKILIVAGGEKLKIELLKDIAHNSVLIIGADGGCDLLAEAEIIPNFVVGDFDSAMRGSVEALISRGAKKIQYNPEKDFTDSEIAFNLAIEQGASEVILTGVTGSRFDHTFGNLGLLLKAVRGNIEAEIINNNNKIFLVDKSRVLKKDANYKYISFLAYGGTVDNLSIQGAKYSLEGYSLQIGDSRTVSNEFLEEDVHINFDSGKLLVIYSVD